jgi:hypothetical protein
MSKFKARDYVMSATRKKVSVLFLTGANVDELGLKYLILNLNKIQTCFEFEFPEIDDYPLPLENWNDPTALLQRFVEITKGKDFKSDYFVGIVNIKIGKEWFWGSIGNFGIITTFDWKKIYSPPSVLEYVIHSIVSLLAVMSDKSNTLDSHIPTRGCFLDYMRSKAENRVDTALGYVCDDCKLMIISKLGKEYLDCFMKINSLDWIGGVKELNSVSYNLKKNFRIDLTKDTGLSKTKGQRIGEYLLALPKEAISYSLSTAIGIVVGLAISHFLGIATAPTNPSAFVFKLLN